MRHAGWRAAAPRARRCEPLAARGARRRVRVRRGAACRGASAQLGRVPGAACHAPALRCGRGQRASSLDGCPASASGCAAAGAPARQSAPAQARGGQRREAQQRCAAARPRRTTWRRPPPDARQRRVSSCCAASCGVRRGARPLHGPPSAALTLLPRATPLFGAQRVARAAAHLAAPQHRGLHPHTAPWSGGGVPRVRPSRGREGRGKAARSFPSLGTRAVWWALAAAAAAARRRARAPFARSRRVAL